jgi:hypothetical protein
MIDSGEAALLALAVLYTIVVFAAGFGCGIWWMH